jgi:hypothetical protein
MMLLPAPLRKLDGMTQRSISRSKFSRKVAKIAKFFLILGGFAAWRELKIGSTEYHRTNIELELSKNNVRSLPPIPHPKGRFRANGSHQRLASDPDSGAFSRESVGVGELVLIGGVLRALEAEALVSLPKINTVFQETSKIFKRLRFNAGII